MEVNTNTPLLISFSGGRTSAFMTRFLTEYSNEYSEKVIVFANTGKEKRETLDFVNECDKRWNLGVVWVEALIYPEVGKGTSFTIVSYETASRKGEPFKAMIDKYSVPTKSFPHCTRELKQRPITKYMQSLGHNYWHCAMGIRADERHRIKTESPSNQFAYIYPLASTLQVDLPFIRNWWSRQPFDLQLKDYEGNCDLCWKKSLRKRMTLIAENPGIETQWEEWEGGSEYKFDRNNYSIAQIREMSKRPFQKVMDSHQVAAAAPGLFEPVMDTEFDCFCKST